MALTEWFINCPKGLESLLAVELDSLGAATVKETVAGVYAGGDLSLAYRACLWSRLANRVLLPLGRFPVDDADQLYEAVRTVPWQDHLSPECTLAVDFIGRNDAIRHSQFGAQRVKDGIVDALVAACGKRPSVDLRHPDIRINARLSKGRLALSLDLSGDSLHRRGYRQAMVPAPLKENLAAALLLRAEWPAIAAEGGALIDPLCGSGTLLIEGAMMVSDIAPGLMRHRFGFHAWRQHRDSEWRELVDEARERRARGLARELPEIRGYDKDSRAVEAAQTNIAAAGLEKVARVSAKPLAALKQPTHKTLKPGLVITNPPYGERWGEMEELRPLYQTLGEVARREFPGWRLAVFTGNPELAREIRLRSERKYRLFNGTIAAQLFLFPLREEPAGDGSRREPPPLSEGARMFANRLDKNARKLRPWLKRTGVTCYRLYDNDMPEYAVAVDIYGDAVHVQEYAPPASVDPDAARRRLSEVRQVLLQRYPASRDRIVFKERRQQKGSDQYRPHAVGARESLVFPVSEEGARLEINLTDYLDTGLFLDHRPVRALLRKMAAGRRFLNLFCYTGAATVHAALGGAVESLSIDMSNSYLEWAARNLEMNGLDTGRHRLLRADCLEWLAEGEGRYDLIFLDPPTFSNSKKMAGVLDIQRDHPRLIRHTMALLEQGGTLVFSNNFRRFRMDDSIAENFRVEDITADTIPPDFARNPKIHNCWRITHR